MSLDAVRITNYSESDFNAQLSCTAAPVFEKWRNFPVSRISHHGKTCCEIAREWLFSMDSSHLNGGSVLTGPRWIRERYEWGPTRWQIHWCEAVRRKSLDCGAQAALANAVFTIRGARSYPAQFVQKFTTDATRHWSRKWKDAQTSLHWINRDLIYHEGCAVLVSENEIKVWDASAGWWISSKQSGGYGSLLAIRLIGEAGFFKWGEHIIRANEWLELVSNGNLSHLKSIADEKFSPDKPDGARAMRG